LKTDYTPAVAIALAFNVKRRVYWNFRLGAGCTLRL